LLLHTTRASPQISSTSSSSFSQHVKDPYTFVWVDGNCYTDFADEFNVQPSKLPTLVAYSPKKNRYAGFIGAADTRTKTISAISKEGAIVLFYFNHIYLSS
jgi:hypothetical protein